MCCVHLQDDQNLFQMDTEPSSKTSEDYGKKKAEKSKLGRENLVTYKPSVL